VLSCAVRSEAGSVLGGNSSPITNTDVKPACKAVLSSSGVRTSAASVQARFPTLRGSRKRMTSLPVSLKPVVLSAVLERASGVIAEPTP